MIARAWKSSYPDDKVLTIRMGMKNWKRTVRQVWSAAEKAFYKVDKAYLVIAVISSGPGIQIREGLLAQIDQQQELQSCIPGGLESLLALPLLPFLHYLPDLLLHGLQQGSPEEEEASRKGSRDSR